MKPPKSQVTTVHEVTRKSRVELNDRDLLELLREHYEIPASATVSIYVECGGYCGTEVWDIDRDTPVIVSWTTTERESNTE